MKTFNLYSSEPITIDLDCLIFILNNNNWTLKIGFHTTHPNPSMYRFPIAILIHQTEWEAYIKFLGDKIYKKEPQLQQ